MSGQPERLDRVLFAGATHELAMALPEHKADCGCYRRREPQMGVLHRLLAAHLETYLTRTVEAGPPPSLSPFIEKELRQFLTCGILAHGFARVRCASWGKDALVAFSCKGRGFCPSRGGVSPDPAQPLGSGVRPATLGQFPQFDSSLPCPRPGGRLRVALSARPAHLPRARSPDRRGVGRDPRGDPPTDCSSVAAARQPPTLTLSQANQSRLLLPPGAARTANPHYPSRSAYTPRTRGS